MNRNYEDWLKYYENATKEDVIQDMMLDINSIKEKDKEIDRLNDTIRSLSNVINELDEHCDTDRCEIERLNNIIELATYYIDNYMYEDYAYCGSEDRLKQILSGNDFILKQLKELKEGEKNVKD